MDGDTVARVSSWLGNAIALVDLAIDHKKGALTVDLAATRQMLIESQRTIERLDDESRSLKKELANLRRLRDDLEYAKPFYWSKNGDGPFCPVCIENSEKAIHLTEILRRVIDKSTHHCGVCENRFAAAPRPTS